MEICLAVVGDRHYSDYQTFSGLLRKALESFPAQRIVTGDATGVDTMARVYAQENMIPVTIYCASIKTFAQLIEQNLDARLASDWGEDGLAAGPIRNAKLVSHPALKWMLLFNGGGPGSRSVKRLAEQKGIEIEEHVITRGTNVAPLDQTGT